MLVKLIYNNYVLLPKSEGGSLHNKIKFAISLLLTILLWTCAPSKDSQNQTADSNLMYKITISTGGGFTGEQTGYIIDTLGKVSSFTRKPNSSAVINSKGTLKPEDIHQLNKLLPSIVNTTYKMNGNMTTSISLESVTQKLSFSWSGTEPGNNVPAELKQFYSTVKNIVANVKE
jgi:hypothetical protein